MRKNPNSGDAQKITALPLTGNQWAATIYGAESEGIARYTQRHKTSYVLVEGDLD